LLLHTTVIKRSRHQNGWTQQHLADACGVSLRTIQRVEKNGAASNETMLALASVFELAQSALRVIPDVNVEELQPVNLAKYQWGLLLASLTGASVGALITFFVTQ